MTKGPKIIDLTGKRFGKLLVLRRSKHRVCGHIMWDCICDCGIKKTVQGGHLKRGATKSCHTCGRVKYKVGDKVGKKKIIAVNDDYTYTILCPSCKVDRRQSVYNIKTVLDLCALCRRKQDAKEKFQGVSVNGRTGDMIALKKKGWTLQEIGDKYEVSRQRIEQILKGALDEQKTRTT